MKKILYVAAALVLVAASCTKTELSVEKTYDLPLSITAGTTKVSYDGNGLIEYAANDGFKAVIASPADSTTAIRVASKAGALASQYYYNFKIVDPTAPTPEFKGAFYSIVGDDYLKEYVLYGLFGKTYSVLQDVSTWVLTIGDTQKATQTSWDPQYTAMLAIPASVNTENASYDSQYDEYSTEQEASLMFSHLFGYAKIQFAGVPAQYASLPVKTVKIEATGENKDLAGNYVVDITKPADVAITGVSSSKPSVTIEGDGVTSVEDFVAWYVLNPGVFDVTITVETARATLVFERSGLNIKRSNIAAPVVNFKSADIAKSKDVTLVGGENWKAALSSSNTLSSSYKEREWGPADKPMVFSLSYPNSTNVNYGSSSSSSLNERVQIMAYNNISGGSAVLSSAASFHGVKLVKAKLGVATKDVVGDFSVSLVNNGVESKLGTITCEPGVTGSYDAKAYCFTANEVQDGDLKITFDNMNETNCRPFIYDFEINPAPWFDTPQTVKFPKDASDSTIVCDVYAAYSAPSASTDASWLTVSYVDGKIKLTATANTGVKRKAVVKLAANGLVAATDSFSVVQASATAKEYKLSVSAADLLPYATAAKAALEAEGKTVSNTTYTTLNTTFKAVATDGSDLKKDVAIDFKKVYVNKCTDTEFFYLETITSAASVGEITNVYIESAHKLGTSNYGLHVKLSEDGTTWTKLTEGIVNASTTTPYKDSVVNEDDSYTWFQINDGGWSNAALYKFEVTFVAD